MGLDDGHQLAVISAPEHQPIRLARNEDGMYDIYLNGRRDLLVVRAGFSVPSHLSGRWKRKKRVRSVSDKIREDVQRNGYYRRHLIDRTPDSRSLLVLNASPDRASAGHQASEHIGKNH